MGVVSVGTYLGVAFHDDVFLKFDSVNSQVVK